MKECVEQAALDAARLEGAQLAASTVQHYLHNQLAVTRGYAELVARDPRLPRDLREKILRAAEGAKAASETLDSLLTLSDLRPDTVLLGGSVLALDRTASPGSPRRDRGHLAVVV